ncbi:MAG: hypothetical protein Q7T03_06270 [Deltaproteobacteria bacterium]|nr:hypothetical protein [Deltaproteobacteria bacterium]
MKFSLILLGMILALPAMAKPISVKSAPMKTGKHFLVEKLGKNEFAIARCYLDHFVTLTPKERILLYYLTRASIAGRDIYYDQRHRDALQIRDLAESLLSEEAPPNLKKKFLTYAKYIWINNSQYHVRSGLKFAPPFTFEELQSVLPETYFERIRASIFDVQTEPVLTNLTPTADEGDIIQASAVNIYDRSLTLAQIEGQDAFWKAKLNVRFAKSDSKVVPQVYKVDGVNGKQLSNIVHFLKQAIPLTDGNQKKALENLVRYYETGDEKFFKESSIDWLKSDSKVDTINGFVETYMDPRQMVGSFEGIAYSTLEEPVLTGISENVQYFEDRMPWADIYKRKKISSKPVANLIEVAVATGEGGPVTWGGINLPNYQDVRSKYGSKNVVLTNVLETRAEVTKELTIKEFYLPEYQAMVKKNYKVAREMILYLHEVIGHGSGTAAQNLRVDPREVIGKNYGAWEEARADLVALHQVGDSKLAEIGAFEKENQEAVIKAVYLLELQGQLQRLRGAQKEDVLREAHDRAGQLIFEYLRQNTKGFEVVNVRKKYYVRILDLNDLRQGVSQLLKIVQEAKATGDKKTVDNFMEKYGTTFNKEWRNNIVARAEKIGLPELIAIVFPKLVPVFKDDKLVDIELKNNESFVDQQLRFGRISQTTLVSGEYY